MSSGNDLIEQYQREMKFLDEQEACGRMMELDQEVPLSRDMEADFLKTDIKTEVDVMEHQQPQLFNVLSMDDALGVSPAPSKMGVVSAVSTSALPTTIWQTPFCSSTTANSSSNNNIFCTSDYKDSLDTPTPFCSNAVNGLKWEPTSFSVSDTNTTGFQPGLLSSPLLSSTAALSTSATSSMQSSSTLHSSMSSHLSSSSSSSSVQPHRDSFLFQESSTTSSFTPSSFTLSDTRFDPSTPFSSSSPSSMRSASSSTSSSLLSSPSLSPSPASSGSLLSELGFTPAATGIPAVKTSHTSITNGLAGSGCILVSNPLGEPPQQALAEDALEYIDLDRQQPFSMYEEDLGDIKPQNNNIINNNNNSNSNSNIILEGGEHVLDDPELFAGLHKIHEILQKGCEELNIPFDPVLWTPEQVQCWVSSVCHKQGWADVSSQLYPVDGATLYVMPESAFHPYGEAGRLISMEINYFKAAKTVMNEDTLLPQTNMAAYSVSGSGSVQQVSQQALHSSPCVSPAPSSGSNSQCSSTGFSTQSDHSDDEGFFSSSDKRKPSTPTKSSGLGGGRGIYLWQFLVELLTSGDPAHADCIRWIDLQRGIFKIEDSKKVAFLWGKRKNRPMMNYDKLSRSVRQYYKKGIIKKTEQSRRLVYQFCESTLASISRPAK